MCKYSKARRRNERQGLLVEKEALEKAEAECDSDDEQRSARRKREKILRDKKDEEYIKQFAAAIRQRYPHCPRKREFEIARHACSKYSGRVGRSAAAKEFQPEMIDLAVMAHVRHRETDYDEMLMDNCLREIARGRVRGKINSILAAWKEGS